MIDTKVAARLPRLRAVSLHRSKSGREKNSISSLLRNKNKLVITPILKTGPDVGIGGINWRMRVKVVCLNNCDMNGKIDLKSDFRRTL